MGCLEEALNHFSRVGKATLCPLGSGLGGRESLGCVVGTEAFQAPKQALAEGDLYLSSSVRAAGFGAMGVSGKEAESLPGFRDKISREESSAWHRVGLCELLCELHGFTLRGAYSLVLGPDVSVTWAALKTNQSLAPS